MNGRIQKRVRNSSYFQRIHTYFDNLVNINLGEILRRVQPGDWSTDQVSCLLRSYLLNTELEDKVIFCHITFALVHKHLNIFNSKSTSIDSTYQPGEIQAGILLNIKNILMPLAATLLLKWHLVWGKEPWGRKQNHQS